jgi:hypothetical protein
MRLLTKGISSPKVMALIASARGCSDTDVDTKEAGAEMINLAKTSVAALAFSALAALVPLSAQAATYDLTFNQVNGDNPSGFATATFADVAGGVQLSINLGPLSGGEFVSSIFFNFTGSEAALDNLTFTRTGGNGPTSFTEVSTLNSQSDNNGAANTVGRYDIGLLFANNNSNPAQRFDADETLIFSHHITRCAERVDVPR